MARLNRLAIPGHPHHLCQRGNNNQLICLTDADRHCLLALVSDSARRFSVAVHAYVVMPTHFHLLATPNSADGLPQMMQAIGRRYVRYFNDAHGRSGTLWNGRYRANVLQAEQHLLECMAYLDLNPVRSGLVEAPEQYPWSSHRHYLGLVSDGLVTPHPLIWSLGNTPFAREARYAEMVRAGLSAGSQQALTDAMLGGWALGDSHFVAKLQTLTGRRLMKSTPGRPSKVKKNMEM